MSKVYRAGIYCRLSTDDASNSAKAKSYIPADDSASIENQREILSKIVMLNGWVETKTYVDDGYSGGNFQRPGFLEMLEDARKGIINLILVKDLSRLGRDYVEVGRYTDIVFPSLGCRFVSVLDSLDSEGDNTDMLHFRSLMNDYHLRDLSNKIKSVLRSKKQAGQFIAVCAPYGYRKSDEDSHKLVIDEYAAGIVRQIFDMRQRGVSCTKIIAFLNTSGVLPPSLYRCSDGGNKGIVQGWSLTTLRRMLCNEVYRGNLCVNRRGSRSYKDRTAVRKPESEWIRHEATHEAIISEETWNAVQEINALRKLKSPDNHPVGEKMFSGKLLCADCKALMVGTPNPTRLKSGEEVRYLYYRCRTYLRSGRSLCTLHTVSESSLVKIVIEEIKAQSQAVVLDEDAVVNQLKQRIAGYDEQRLSTVRQEIGKLRRRVQELENMTARLYEDKFSGALNEDAFVVLMQKNERERMIKVERLTLLLSEVEQSEKKIADIHTWTETIRKYLNLQKLDRAIIDELIDHIEVGESTVVDGHRRQDIKIFYRFVGLV